MNEYRNKFRKKFFYSIDNFFKRGYIDEFCGLASREWIPLRIELMLHISEKQSSWMAESPKGQPKHRG